MKKALLPFLIVSVFFSCKKDDPVTEPTIVSSKDPAALSKSIKVWHGTRSTAAIPAPNGMGPEVEGPMTDHVMAFGGKFAVVQPAVMSGNVKGYYVKIDGAPDHFKVDYSTPRTTGKNLLRKSMKNMARRDPPTGPSADSSVVLILPPNIQMPDTFCITYYPYDSLNNVGFPITTCIIVTQLGGNASTNWLQGAWRIYGTKEDPALPYDSIIYNRWTADDWSEYYCQTDSSGSFLTTWCDPQYPGCTPMNLKDSTKYVKSDLLINNNGGMQYLYTDMYKYPNLSTSSCSSVSYTTEDYSDIISGGWSVSGNTMTLIFEFDEWGYPVYDAWQYQINQVNATTFELIDNYDPFYPYYILFKKL